MKSVFYVGMDVHKESVRIAVLKGTEKETVYEATVKNDIPRITKIVSKYLTQGSVVAGYEAGCMGYMLHVSFKPIYSINRLKTHDWKVHKNDPFGDPCHGKAIH
jgi:hypothetical protein